MLRVSEIFASIQGEGRFAETPSVFVRTTGCNLRCWYCDTPHTSWRPEGEQIAWRSVAERVLSYPESHVVLTGGEPLLQPDIVPLSGALREAGRFVTVETAGTVFRPATADLMSISPKLTNSLPLAPANWRDRHLRIQENDAVIRQLIRGTSYQLKFVVDEPADLIEIAAYLERFPEVTPGSVWLMPQGISAGELSARLTWLTPWAAEHGYRVSPRRHIELFGHRRGT
jgi:7-carboxy-7-deazaguanine synthase